MRDNLQHDRIRVGWVIVRLCVLVAAVILFNFFPERVGVLVSATDPHSFVPVLAPDFCTNMPWLNLWWGLALLLEMAHLYLRRWLPLTRWADLALGLVAGRVLLQVMLQGPILVSPESAAAAWSQLLTLPPAWEQSGVAVLDLLIRGGLALAILGIAVDTLQKLYHLLPASQQHPLPAQ